MTFDVFFNDRQSGEIHMIGVTIKTYTSQNSLSEVLRVVNHKTLDRTPVRVLVSYRDTATV